MNVTPGAPAESEQTWYGADYVLDLLRCRHRIVELTAAKTYAGLREVAHAVGVSRFTLYRFLDGDRVSIVTVRAVCDKLQLPFEEIARPKLETAAA